jgi:hypothetical protein
MKDYSTFGMAALLPGMQHMLDEMQNVLNTFRENLEAAQAPGKKRGRPRKIVIEDTEAVKKSRRSAGYWAKMTPEQRSAEMKRRAAVIVAKGGKSVILPRGGKLHPRDPRHPGHEAWLAKLRAAQKKTWANMSKAKQRAQQARMQAGRRPQVKMVNGAEAVA